MIQKKGQAALAAAFVALFFGAVFYFGWFADASANNKVLWITADKAEVAHIQNLIQQRGGTMPFRVVEEREGISIMQLDELFVEDLSREMHSAFHKCAGFSAHDTFQEASDFVNGALRADANAVAVDYTIDNAENAVPLIAAVDEPYTRQVIIDLSAFPNRRYNQPSGQDSAEWIKNRWTQLAEGRSDITVEYFTHPTSTSPQPSVIMTITGTELPDEIVVLGGHQDSINSWSGSTGSAPGADDDASGIASLTDTIRVLTEMNFRPARTIQFMAYAAEEVGLRGSNAIAANYQTKGINVVGVLQLDMTNYRSPSSLLDIALVTDRTNAAQNQFLRDLISEYMPSYFVGDTTCGYGCSDHSSWNSRGVPASFPHESTLSNSNDLIHTANDTIAHSGNNANHAIKFNKLALAFVAELAKGEIVDANVTTREKFDYDGDGRADLSVFRPDNGAWYINGSTEGFMGYFFGLPTDRIVPGDYDGDGKTDLGIYRDGMWHVLGSSDGYKALQFGIAEDIPVVEDFDGDGISDIAVFRASAGMWHILRSKLGYTAVSFGMTGDIPVTADYDGDGIGDVAFFRSGNWHILKSGSGYAMISHGMAGDIPVTGDFDGDGRSDLSVFRDGMWHRLGSESSSVISTQFGIAGDVPVAGDYDGDGKWDIGVYRGGIWYRLYSSDGAFRADQFGLPADKPTEAAFVQ